MSGVLLPRVAATAWDSGDQQWALLTAAAGHADVFGVLARLLSLVALALPVAATSYLLVRVTRKGGRKIWSATRGRPQARTAAVVAPGGARRPARLGLVARPAVHPGPPGRTRHDRKPGQRDLDGSRARWSADPRGPGRPLHRDTAHGGRARAPHPRQRSGAAPRPAGAAGAGAGGTGPLRTIVTGGTGGQATGRAFPFAVPPAAGPGDNQAVALARPMAVCSTTSRTPWCG